MVPAFDRRLPRHALAAALLALPALVLSGSLASLQAQQTGTITGEVRNDESLEPLAGVQVHLPQEGLGTLTNEEGRYLLQNVPAGQVQIRAEIVGYQTVTRSVTVDPGGSAEVDFELSPQALALEELLVTATGLQRSREIGNAVANIQAEEIVEVAKPASVEGLLQSRTPGVAIRSNTGSLGTAGDIKIRGASSISLTSRPLVYVDGARISSDAFDAGVLGQDYSRLNDLNPNEIESVEIVKGPAASTLYGTEAASGVIRITTKKGEQQAPRYNFRVEYGANWDDTDWDPTLWNPRSFFGEVAKDTVYEMRLLETDSPFRTGWEKTVGGNVRGGFEGVGYFVSGEWTDRNGQTARNEHERYNFRANLSLDPSDEVDISVSNGITNTYTSLPDADNSGSGLVAQAYLGFPWVMPIEATDPNNPDSGPIRTCPQNVEVARITGQPLSELGFEGCSEKPGFGGRNQADLQTLSNYNHTLRYTGSADFVYRPIDAWTNRITAGYDYLTDRWTELTPVDPDMPFGTSSLGDLDNRQVRSQNLTLDASSSFDYDLTPDLNTITTAGVQFFREFLEMTQSTGEIFPAGSPAVNNAVLNQGTDSHNEVRTLGLFVQEQLGWRDRLFITPAVRFDQNSAFGQELGLKTYPRVSGSWVASDEPFTPDFFEMLKLRVAWGLSGEQPGPNDALELLTPTPVIMQGEEVLGVRPNRPGNEQLKPETGREWEVGFDLRTWEGRVGVEFTAFHQITEDALVQRPLPASTGFPGSRWENVGELKNRGIEFGLDFNAVRRPELNWDWYFQVSTLDTEITQLEEPIVFGSQRHVEGHPFGGYWEKPVFIGDDGEVQVRDEHEFMGVPLPKWEGSLSQTLTVLDGMVSLYGNFAFAGGHKLLNFSDVFRCRWVGGGTYGGVCTGIHERDENGEFTDEARIKQRASLNNFSNAPWIEDADWLKLRTVSLTFRLPEEIAAAGGAERADLSFTTENVATWTPYSGEDPEAHWAGGTSEASRAEFYTVPPARRFITSLSISF